MGYGAKYTGGPSPFKASILVRFPHHRQVIENEWAHTEKDGDKILDFIQSQVQTVSIMSQSPH